MPSHAASPQIDPGPPRPADDPSLVESARSGDGAARAALYRDTYADVCRAFARAWRLPASHLDVRAAANDVFTELCERSETTGRCRWAAHAPALREFRSYVVLIARRRALNALRDARTRTRQTESLAHAMREGHVAEVARTEAVAELRAILGRMSPKYARALLAVDYGGESLREAAALLGVGSYSAANSQLGRARIQARDVARALRAENDPACGPQGRLSRAR
jgi:RNA polymerase sigma factor (sigma-70 family)